MEADTKEIYDSIIEIERKLLDAIKSGLACRFDSGKIERAYEAAKHLGLARRCLEPVRRSVSDD